MRINKYLSSHGVCSRRAADRFIEEGVVMVNNKRAKIGDDVTDNDVIIVGNKVVNNDMEFYYIAYNKPKGVEVTMNREVKHNIADALGLKGHIFPIGRLDKDSSGLILLTNDGDTANKILHPSFGHEKEYLVHVERPISHTVLKQLASGVKLEGTRTQTTRVSAQNKTSFKMILSEGRNRQIRKMVERLGYRVTQLKRIRVMNIKLGHLKTGHWRMFTKTELAEFKSQL